jgi:hypothetical protein
VKRSQNEIDKRLAEEYAENLKFKAGMAERFNRIAGVGSR